MMFTPTERQAMIDKIRRLPEDLAASVSGWNDMQLDYQPAPAEWCARQVIHHVADSHMNAFIRMKLALTTEQPTINPYDQVAWAELPDARTLPVEVSLQIIRALHTRWVLLWEHLTEAEFQRTYFHPEDQEQVTLASQLQTYSWHGHNHVEQIARIAQAQGW